MHGHTHTVYVKFFSVVDVQVKMSNPKEMDGLLDAKAYAKHVEESDH
jgi:hypothetical protein